MNFLSGFFLFENNNYTAFNTFLQCQISFSGAKLWYLTMTFFSYQLVFRNKNIINDNNLVNTVNVSRNEVLTNLKQNQVFFGNKKVRMSNNCITEFQNMVVISISPIITLFTLADQLSYVSCFLLFFCVNKKLGLLTNRNSKSCKIL